MLEIMRIWKCVSITRLQMHVQFAPHAEMPFVAFIVKRATLKCWKHWMSCTCEHNAMLHSETCSSTEYIPKIKIHRLQCVNLPWERRESKKAQLILVCPFCGKVWYWNIDIFNIYSISIEIFQCWYLSKSFSSFFLESSGNADQYCLCKNRLLKDFGFFCC